MWIYNEQVGFLSVVAAQTAPGVRQADPSHLNVRARQREHLELLQGVSKELAAIPIQESPGHDYRYRLVPVNKRDFADAIRELVLSIDYLNFKSACQASGHIDGSVLHQVWRATLNLQQ